MMKNILLFLVCAHIYADISIPKHTTQLIVVSSDDFESPMASLRAYEKIGDSWTNVFGPFTVNIGRSGLAWGQGLYAFNHPSTEPVKQEGDGKSPAGLFTLESFFGYEQIRFDFPYAQVTASTLCVDDSTSSDYNRIVQSEDGKQYASFEYMKREDELYRLGIVVGHNRQGIKQGGSCIFMHIQRNNDSATSGCTSMSPEQLLQLMKWLKKANNPLLLQLPKPYLKQGFN
jgi:L,D-peptidoglycan transpeptidase YkuD (ErfK/YbiS/YcfS/YnhG family)